MNASSESVSANTARRIAPQIVLALVEIITGGSANRGLPPIGVYRSGPDIVRFFMRNGYHDSYGTWSRVSHTEEKVQEILRMDEGPTRILRLVEDAVKPTDYLSAHENLEAAVAYLNQHLQLESLELRWDGRRYRIYEGTGITAATAEAQRVVDALDFDACRREFNRALENLADDPAAAITAASSTLESIAKTMLGRLDEPLPSDQSIGPLVTSLGRRLGLLPEGQDDQDLRRLLGGLSNAVQAVGALRARFGSAHGRGDGPDIPLRDLAELCVNTSAAIALFLLRRYASLAA